MTPSQNTRRSFLATLGLTTGYAAAEMTSASLPGVQLTSHTCPERDVLSVVSKYGACLKTTREEGKVEYLIQMSDAEKFVKVFNPMKALPFDEIQVSENNTLAFTHQGVRFTLNHAS